MSKFLKAIVNIILIGSILVSAGLLIPPFVGVTTVIVDDLDMETNLPVGSVTYALEKNASELQVGNKILMTELEAQNLYEVTAIEGNVYTLEDQLSVDGQTQEYQLSNIVKKVLITVPFIGYVSMALKTTEGLIIVGLTVVFVIILFILAEIWKKDDDDDEEDDDETDASEEDEEDEEPQLSKRQLKKAKKAEAKAAKQAEKEAKKAAKKAKKKGADEEAVEEVPESEQIVEPETVQEETEAEKREDASDEQALFEETSSCFAADIAEMMGITPEQTENTEEAVVEVKEPVVQEEVEEEPAEEKKLAMPVYTKEELLAKAEKAGEAPAVREDEYSGITIIDYSDVL
ncbi:MAG: hypothetical protein U0L12_11440 [Ruminococcus sp.]|nr:hypothetical protein [Ruminococcus sp.]